jgi:1,4-dihydroxy-2-naphthoyl-CoA hydrolase
MPATARRPGMPEYFGIRITSAEPDRVTAELDCDERHTNALGVMHGGALMAFADELGGHGASLNIAPGARTTTLESKTNFIRACAPGRVTAIAIPLHRGRRTSIWQTSIHGPDGKLVAMVTQTQLVLD